MAISPAVTAQIATSLVDGERVLMATVSQVKQGQKRAIAKATLGGVARSLAVSAATGGSVGLLVAVIPASAWLVVTTERVLLFEAPKQGPMARLGVGPMLFSAPRAALVASTTSRPLSEVTVADRTDGQSLFKLNLGVKRGTAREIVTSIEGAATDG